MMDATVLDGDQRSALAVTRSLGRKGIRVTVGSEKRKSLASCSRYCSQTFLYPSPYDDPEGFIHALIDHFKNRRPSILFPMTDVTLTEIMSRKEDFSENTVLPFMDYMSYMEVTDKIRLFQLARSLSVPIPSTFPSAEYDDREKLMEEVSKSGFPVVVKSNLSKIRTGNGWVNSNVFYARNRDELSGVLSKDIFRKFPFLVQKQIVGPGVGIFLLMRDGDVIARFAHRRLREKPPSGGVSVLSESIEPPPDALHSAVKILNKLRWTGIAMVEFKMDRDRQAAKLLEVNARFWGSLQLAVYSGVDFPYLLYRTACNEKTEEVKEYVIGMKSRWELGDLDHLLIRLFKNPSKLNLNPDCPSRAMVMKDFIADFFRPSVRNEIFQNTDIGPFLYEMKMYINHFC
jgi:predicted ATP-grasp superfamily ATP-dependent carboligase